MSPSSVFCEKIKIFDREIKNAGCLKIANLRFLVIFGLQHINSVWFRDLHGPNFFDPLGPVRQ